MSVVTADDTLPALSIAVTEKEFFWFATSGTDTLNKPPPAAAPETGEAPPRIVTPVPAGAAPVTWTAGRLVSAVVKGLTTGGAGGVTGAAAVWKLNSCTPFA